MVLRNICFLLILIPVFSNAQSDSIRFLTKDTEMLNKWYKNSYQTKSASKSILGEGNSAYNLRFKPYKKDMNFLYYSSFQCNYFPQMPYANSPVRNFYSPAGNTASIQSYPEFGSFLLFYGIDYIVDRKIFNKKR